MAAAKCHPRAIALLLTAGVASCGTSVDAERARAVHVSRLLPLGVHTALPDLHLAPDGTVAMTYVAGGGGRDTLFLAQGAPRRQLPLASGDDWFVNWADRPSAARLADGRLVSHVLDRTAGGTYDYAVRYRLDAGEPATLHDDRGLGEHGFVSWVTPGDSAQAFWLDGRATAGAHDGREHGHGGGGAMQLRTRTVGPDGGLGPERLVDDRVCDCCPTAAALTSRGPIVVYRDRSEGEVRDVYRALPATDSPPAPIHVDGWQIAGCPVNGPSVAASPSGDTVAVAWFTAVPDGGRVQLAWSTDGGVNFGPPATVADGGALGRVDLAWVGPSRVAAAYLGSPQGERAALTVEFLDIASRRPSPPRVLVDSVAAARSSGVPSLTAASDGIYVAYTEVLDGGATRVRLAQLTPP